MTIPTQLLRGLATAALATLSLGAAQATTVQYGNAGTFTASSVNIGGVVVTGSNLVSVLAANGLGVVGGFDDRVVDGTEYLDFSFAGLGGATDVSYFNQLGGNLNGNGLVGERTLTVFGLGDTLLGSFDESGAGSFSISSLVGNATVEHFRLQARQDDFLLTNLSFTAQAGSPVPEPASLALAGLALAGLAATRRGAG